MPTLYSYVKNYQCDGVGGVISGSDYEARAETPEQEVRRPYPESRMWTLGRH